MKRRHDEKKTDGMKRRHDEKKTEHQCDVDEDFLTKTPITKETARDNRKKAVDIVDGVLHTFVTLPVMDYSDCTSPRCIECRAIVWDRPIHRMCSKASDWCSPSLCLRCSGIHVL